MLKTKLVPTPNGILYEKYKASNPSENEANDKLTAHMKDPSRVVTRIPDKGPVKKTRPIESEPTQAERRLENKNHVFFMLFSRRPPERSTRQAKWGGEGSGARVAQWISATGLSMSTLLHVYLPREPL